MTTCEQWPPLGDDGCFQERIARPEIHAGAFVRSWAPIVEKTRTGDAIRRARRRGAQLEQLDELIAQALLRNDLGE
jgi:hypothetical protein